jgi:hypothetical protein
MFTSLKNLARGPKPFLLVLPILLLLTPFAAAEPRKTRFDPKTHGFRFVNDFTNDAVPALDIRTSGLCNGMSYAALDYYFAGRPVPTQTYRPANRTPLQSYLYNRNVTSILRNLDKWAELRFNPFGVRDNEFFEWGLRGSGGGRLQELRSYIDRGIPVPICLQGHKTGSHCVVAIGYDLGRYKGDLKANKGDLKIFVYDPNNPGDTMTLVPDLDGKIYTYVENREKSWRAYFVDTRYARQTPPSIRNVTYPSDGKVHELILAFETGDDDLRGGNDNIDLQINFYDGTQQTVPNINRSARWLPKYTESVSVKLARPILKEWIKSLVLNATTRGGPSGDNWDMKKMSVQAVVGGQDNLKPLGDWGFNRFTGDRKQLTIPINPPPPAARAARGQVARLVFEIRTGNDDMRGGNDNLNIELRFKDGRLQRELNVNKGARWADYTTHTVTIDLNKPVPVGQITGILFATTFSGGWGGDNWNMDWVRVRAQGPGVDQLVATYGFNRFTGDRKQLNIPVRPVAAAAPGQVNRVVFEIRTGNDDMRGGNDNLNIELRFKDGKTHKSLNVNSSARWADYTTHTVTVDLPRPMAPTDIKGMLFATTFRGGIGGDNWNMDWVRVRAQGPGVDRQIATYGFNRFTGDRKQLNIPVKVAGGR